MTTRMAAIRMYCGWAIGERGRLLDEPPAVVLASTRNLVERENHLMRFVRACAEATENPRDHVVLKQLYPMYTEFCQRERVSALKKTQFKEQVSVHLGAVTDSSNGETNFWRGWRAVLLPPRDDPVDFQSGSFAH